MVEYLIECNGTAYMQVDLVWRIILVLLIGLTLIHTLGLAAVLLGKFVVYIFSFCNHKRIGTTVPGAQRQDAPGAVLDD